jgi:hypothetical protein
MTLLYNEGVRTSNCIVRAKGARNPRTRHFSFVFERPGDARATARRCRSRTWPNHQTTDAMAISFPHKYRQQLTYEHRRFFHSSWLPVRLVSLLLSFVLYLSFPFSCGACLPLQLLQRLRLRLLLIQVSVRFDQPLHSPRDAELKRHLST